LWNGDMVSYLAKSGLPEITTCKNDALKAPLTSDPGTRWGIRHQYRFRRQGRGSRQRHAARRVFAR
jgi:hypothetical protein